MRDPFLPAPLRKHRRFTATSKPRPAVDVAELRSANARQLRDSCRPKRQILNLPGTGMHDIKLSRSYGLYSSARLGSITSVRCFSAEVAAFCSLTFRSPSCQLPISDSVSIQCLLKLLQVHERTQISLRPEPMGALFSTSVTPPGAFLIRCEHEILEACDESPGWSCLSMKLQVMPSWQGRPADLV